MGYKAIICVVSSIVWIGAAEQNWPPALKRCTMNERDMEKCLMKATQHAISIVAHGLPELGMKSIDPLRGANFNFAVSRGPITGVVRAENVTVSGPANVKLKKVTFDKRTSTYAIEGFHDLLKMKGKYSVNGNILIFPINSKGSFDFELHGAFANHTLKFSKNTKKAPHGQSGFQLLTWRFMKYDLRDSALGEQANRAVNKLVNDNWRIIANVIKPYMERIVEDIYSNALKPITSKFSVNDFFPASESPKALSDSSDSTF